MKRALAMASANAQAGIASVMTGGMEKNARTMSTIARMWIVATAVAPTVSTATAASALLVGRGQTAR